MQAPGTAFDRWSTPLPNAVRVATSPGSLVVAASPEHLEVHRFRGAVWGQMLGGASLLPSTDWRRELETQWRLTQLESAVLALLSPLLIALVGSLVVIVVGDTVAVVIGLAAWLLSLPLLALRVVEREADLQRIPPPSRPVRAIRAAVAVGTAAGLLLSLAFAAIGTALRRAQERGATEDAGALYLVSMLAVAAICLGLAAPLARPRGTATSRGFLLGVLAALLASVGPAFLLPYLW